MPLYEYECKQCGRRTEKIQKFSDPELTECPFCGGPLERLIHAPAVSFKGGGWYADLYSSAKPGSGNAASSASGATSATKSDSSSTPAASAPSAPAAPAPAASSSSDKK